MATRAQSIVDDFRVSFKDCTVARAYQLLNQVDILVQRTFRQRQKTIYLPMTANESSVALPAGALWIRRARFQPNTTGGFWLYGTSEDALEVRDAAIDTDGLPTGMYQSHDLVGGRLSLVDVPTETTLNITDATNASPIVITSDAVHGLADGDPVSIRAVEGNEAANGDWYAKVTGYGTTTFALYEEYELTTAVAGDGTYTASTGLIGCGGSPFLELEAVWHEELIPASVDQGSLSSAMPDTPFFENLYLNGMAFLWCQRRHLRDLGVYEALFMDAINAQDELTNKRVGHTQRTISAFQPRAGGYSTRSG